MRSIFLTVAAALYATVFAGDSNHTGCGYHRNNNPVLDLPAVPLNSVSNGKSWKMQQGDNVVYIAKVNGSPYEMGYALGQLFGYEINANMNNLLEFAKS